MVWPITGAKSYVCETVKSMKAMNCYFASQSVMLSEVGSSKGRSYAAESLP